MNEKLKTLIALLNIYTETQVFGVKNAIRPAMETLFADVVNPVGELTKEEINAGIYEGKIPCIKLHRGRTNVGLKESKDAVEKYFADNNLNFGNF